MGKIVKLFSIILLQVFMFNNTSAQQYQTLPCSPQVTTPPYTQPPLNTLFSYSSTLPIIDKLGAIASVLKKMPSGPGQINKRQYMAEALKQTALESLMFAANACKCCQAQNGMPLLQPQVTAVNDVMSKRAVNVRYA